MTSSINRGDLVVIVRDWLMREYEQILPFALKKWGYHKVERLYDIRGSLYVRPLPLWLLHKIGHAVYEGFWCSIVFLRRRGVIRLRNQPGTITRLRDIRPWPLAGHGW